MFFKTLPIPTLGRVHVGHYQPSPGNKANYQDSSIDLGAKDSYVV